MVMKDLAFEGDASTTAKAKQATDKFLVPGPVLLSWAVGLSTLVLQATLTDHAQLAQDAAALFPCLQHPVAQHLSLYALLGLVGLGSSFYLMPATFPPLQQRSSMTRKTSLGSMARTTSLEVPHRRPNMKQHSMTAVDYSYIVLNVLCLPGLFYHFICLMRSWGLDFADPPLFGIYPPSAMQLLTETLPHSAPALAFYFIAYEFFYYHWHRAMHEVPILYKWIHRHHHHQIYPDRAALDTLNTGCAESQIGLYLQLTVLLCADKLFGIADLPAGIWFFTIAGYLSVLEHDKFERALPFDIFRADEHHMHHAYMRCNYSPYSVFWDKVFGTYKPFAVKSAPTPAPTDKTLAPVARSPANLIALPPGTSELPPLRAASGATMCVRGGTLDDEANDGPNQEEDDDASGVLGMPMAGSMLEERGRAIRAPQTSSETRAILELFSTYFGVCKSEEQPPTESLEREFYQAVSDRNQVVSDRIWAKHLGMGAALNVSPSHGLKGHAHAQSSSAFSKDDEEASGEVQVIIRGLAYSIAASLNVLFFVASLALSMHLEAPAW